MQTEKKNLNSFIDDVQENPVEEVEMKEDATSPPKEKKVSEEKVESLDEEDKNEHRPEIKLVTEDKKEFMISTKNAQISTLIKTILEQDKEAKEFPVKVQGEMMELVIEYMNHHQGTDPECVPKPLRSKNFAEVVKDPWDAQFMAKVDGEEGKNRQALYDIILAANYLDIKSLLHLGCAKVASLIKGQPIEKIKEILTTGTAKKNVV